MSGILRPLEHMSLLILDVCLRGKSDPVPVAQSSGKFDQSSPTGLQDPQDLQKPGPGSTQTQLLLFPHIRQPASMVSHWVLFPPFFSETESHIV